MNYDRKRQAARKGPASILQDLVEEENNDRPPHVILIEQLFTFIGSNPEKAVSSDCMDLFIRSQDTPECDKNPPDNFYLDSMVLSIKCSITFRGI